MDLALAQLALVFLPGIIWARLDSVYGSGPRVDNVTLTLNSFLFGIATYVFVYFFYRAFGLEFTSSLIDGGSELRLSDFADEIASAIPAAFFMATIWLYSVRFRLVMCVLHRIGATKRFGLEDVWSFTFNSDQPHVLYVDVRDIGKGFTYSGYVNTYSETETFRELLLVDAIVYDESGDLVSEAPHLYLSFAKDSVWIEFPHSEARNVEEPRST